MSEQPLLPPPAEMPEPPSVARKASRRDLVPWFCGLGFLILAAAIFYLWQYPSMPPPSAEEASARQGIEQRLGDAGSRLTRLEQQPSPDLGKITARVDALDGRIAEQTQLATRLDTLSGRIESLSARGQTARDATTQQLDALAGRIAALEANAGSMATVAKRLNRIAKLQEVSFALASGRPIGDVPDAPEALTRYAHAAPPTEAQIRQRFLRAQPAALAAKPAPEEGDAPFIDRVWDRAQGLITIRRGENFVVGNPSATTLGHAQAALEAGDLAAAVEAVESLKGEPAQAMADWLADAKALLGARSALAAMADKV
jgi:hypothetical protein